MGVQVRVRQTCKQCGGEGVVYNCCKICWKRTPGPTAQWKDDTLVLPCGHSARNLVERADCPNCGGLGQFEGWADLESLAAAIRAGEPVETAVTILDEAAGLFGE